MLERKQKKLGFEKVYLLTSLENYYEKYGWKYIGDCFSFGKSEKVYEIESEDKNQKNNGSCAENLTHIGTQKIETERLILRRFETTDTEEMFKNWANNLENCEYLSWSAHKKIDETKKVLSDWISDYSKNDYYRWAITLKETGELIGGIDIILILEHIQCVEFGYVLSKKFWNRGFMTEALKATQKFMFKKINTHRIQARHDVRNPASGKVMTKTGMSFEGVLRESDKSNTDEWINTAIYSILRKELEKA